MFEIGDLVSCKRSNCLGVIIGNTTVSFKYKVYWFDFGEVEEISTSFIKVTNEYLETI
jgi:hypothetical protein